MQQVFEGRKRVGLAGQPAHLSSTERRITCIFVSRFAGQTIRAAVHAVRRGTCRDRRSAADRRGAEPGYPCRVSLTIQSPATSSSWSTTSITLSSVALPHALCHLSCARATRPSTPSTRCRSRLRADACSARLRQRRHDDRPRAGRWRDTRSRDRAAIRETSERPICTSISPRPAVTPRASISRVTALQAARQRISRSAPATIRVRPGHDGRDILERAQQKCRAQRPQRLRLLIPGHRRHVQKKPAPQAKSHGKSDHSESERA